MANADYKIGVVGVGRMGANIARHLNDEGFDVVAVYDVASETRTRTRNRTWGNSSGRTREGYRTRRLYYHRGDRRRGDASDFLGRCR